VGTPSQQRYWYDANGNPSAGPSTDSGGGASGQAVTRRINPAGVDISLTYDQENRLITVSGNRTASYAYDGDGNLVKAVDSSNNITTVVVGPHYEVRNTTPRKYYYAGSVRVAMRDNGTLYWLLTDHLGSTALTLDSSGNRLDPNAELRYKPYGDTRYNPGSQKTNYRFTGQRWDQGHGLYWYNSRWYDPLIGRFMQADTIVPQPGNPQALNRYSYVLGNPLRYTDPTGHQAWVQSIRFPGQSLVGALAIGAEAIDPMPFDPVVIPFGVMLIANDPLWQIYGPQLPALFDKAVEASHSLGRALQGGNTAGPGGLGPNDPRFRATMEARTRFESIGRESVPDILKAYGGKVGQPGGIPDVFSGRRVTTLGRWAQTEPAGRGGARILNVPNWSPQLNSDWIQEAIHNGDVFHLVMDVSDDTASLLNSNPLYKISAFARELDALLKAGYTRVGDYLVPPQ